MKQCKNCNKNFIPTQQFRKYCSKKCSSKASEIWANNNQDKMKLSRKLYSLKNKEKMDKASKRFRSSEEGKKYYKSYNKKYRLENKEKISKYRIENKDKNKEQQKITKIKNKDKYNETNRRYVERNRNRINDVKSKWAKKRRHNDIIYKLTQKLRSDLRRIKKQNRVNKNNKGALNLIGISLEEFKIYIEKKFKPGMTWENHGLYGWHIDHIKPVTRFDLTKSGEMEKCFHYTNLQPMWAKENLRKSNKY